MAIAVARGTILHRDGVGSTWSEIPSGTTNDLSGIWGSGNSDAWAVGIGTIMHWDGSTWTKSETKNNFCSAGGSGKNDVWAVGSAGTIQHWDGSTWSIGPSGTADYLIGVWVSGKSEAWAVGEKGTILHWDGTTWSCVSSGTAYDLLGVWGNETGVWAVGGNGTLLRDIPR